MLGMDGHEDVMSNGGVDTTEEEVHYEMLKTTGVYIVILFQNTCGTT